MPQIAVDKKADAAYLYVADRSENRTVFRTEPLLPDQERGMVNLDFDVNGRLVGIELIPASHFLREQDIERATDAHG